MRTILFSLIAVCLLPQGIKVCKAQDLNRRDGNLWLKLESLPDQQVSKLLRASYIGGLKDGVALEAGFLADVLADSSFPPSDTVVIHNYVSSTGRYSNNISVEQLMDGLDSFYSDYRNRSILLMWAVFYISKEIAGTPETQLNTLIEDLRRNATQ